MKNRTRILVAIALFATVVSAILGISSVNSRPGDDPRESAFTRKRAFMRPSRRSAQRPAFQSGGEGVRQQSFELAEMEGRRAGEVTGREETSQVIQLADNFPLPAAIISNLGRDGDSGGMSLVRQAEDDIAKRFYDQITLQAAKQAAKSGRVDGPAMTVEIDLETTRTLRRSNEQFHALFGNEAYNQASIDSAMEVLSSKLP